MNRPQFVIEQDAEREKGIQWALANLETLEVRPPKDVNKLRWLEGRSAIAYFKARRKMPIKSKNSARRPIQNGWREFSPRSSQFHTAGNRHASHPANARLNYAYAVLQSQTQIRAVASGYDPALGIMHFDQDYAPAFVFDLMKRRDRLLIELF